MRRTFIVASVIGLAVTVGLSEPAHARTRLIYNVIGDSVSRAPNLANGEPAGALCYDVELENPLTGQTIGTATDCLTEITPVGDGVALVGTTFFNLPGGTIVTQGSTTVQPQTTAAGTLQSDLTDFTHITGANGTGNAVTAGTGRFEDASGTARLSGMVNLSAFPGFAVFDCIFVIDLDTP